jgi:hypothetical protein
MFKLNVRSIAYSIELYNSLFQLDEISILLRRKVRRLGG